MLKVYAVAVAVAVYREFGGLVHSGGGSSAVDRRRLAEDGIGGQPELIGGRGLDNFNRLHGNLPVLGGVGSLRGGHVHKEDENHGGGLISMTEDEKKNIDVDRRVDKLETKFEMFMKSQDDKFNAFMRSHEDFKTEIRQQNQMRAEEIRELRQDMKNMQANLDSKIDSMGKHVRNLSVAAMAAVGGMFVAVGVMVGTMIYTLLKH